MLNGRILISLTGVCHYPLVVPVCSDTAIIYSTALSHKCSVYEWGHSDRNVIVVCRKSKFQDIAKEVFRFSFFPVRSVTANFDSTVIVDAEKLSVIE